jgi:hypothetical protein
MKNRANNLKSIEIDKLKDLHETYASTSALSEWCIDDVIYRYKSGADIIKTRASVSDGWEMWSLPKANKIEAKKKILEIMEMF